VIKRKRETTAQNRDPALCAARVQPLPLIINNSLRA